MENNINLVTPLEANKRERDRIFFLRLISVIFLVSVAIISLTLFFINSKLSITAVKIKQNQELQKISAISDKNAKYLLLIDRLKTIKILTKQRRDYSQIINALFENLPEGVEVRSLSLDKDGLSLTVISNSLLPINDFVDKTTSKLDKKFLKDITIEGLSIDNQSGIFSISIKAKVT